MLPVVGLDYGYLAPKAELDEACTFFFGGMRQFSQMVLANGAVVRVHLS